MEVEAALANIVIDLLCKIVDELHKTKDESWYSKVITPLIKTVSVADAKACYKNCFVSVLSKVIALDAGVIDKIFNELETVPQNLAIVCLKLLRQRGQPWEFQKHKTLIEKGLCYHDEDIRLETLSLCVESHSSVEIFSQEELTMLVRKRDAKGSFGTFI